MSATLLSERILHDENGTARICQRCIFPRLATVPFSRGRVDMALCDDHARIEGIDPLSQASIANSLYECGRPIPDIAKAMQVEIAEVMDALGFECYCSDCGRADRDKLGRLGRWVDFGIGFYEFWGARGVDVNKQYVSVCCEAELLNAGGNRYEAECAVEDW